MKVGLCYRDNIHGKWIEDIIPHIDFLELMPDTLDIDTAIKLKNLCIKNNIPIGLHTLKGSLGSLEGPSFNNLKNYFYNHEYFESEYFSDHVAFSHINGQYLSSVFPIDYNEDNINILSENLKYISPYFNNILIENITQNKLSPNNNIKEDMFFNILNENLPDNVSLMFDVTNAYVTAFNNGYNFDEYTQTYPCKNIKCIHVSGYEVLKNGKLRDSHSNNLNENILSLTKKILKKSSPNYLLLERDFNVNSSYQTLQDIEKLRKISIF